MKLFYKQIKLVMMMMMKFRMLLQHLSSTALQLILFIQLQAA